MSREQLPNLSHADVERIGNVLDDVEVPGHTRRALIQRAAFAAAATTATVVPGGTAIAQEQTEGSPEEILNTAITAEELAITYLTGLIAQADKIGGPVAELTDVLRAANAAEFEHYRFLNDAGAKPLTDRFWVPNSFFEAGNVFPTLETAETLFVNAYLIGTTVFAAAGQADTARYTCEIANVEAQHRALARFAQDELPDNVAFEDYSITAISGIVDALEDAGVGFGERGAEPGKFYEFPGEPPSSAVVPIEQTSVS